MSSESDNEDDLDGNAASSRSLPRLLPANPPVAETSSLGFSGRILPTSPSALPPKAKRAHVVPAACEACRKRKSKVHLNTLLFYVSPSPSYANTPFLIVFRTTAKMPCLHPAWHGLSLHYSLSRDPLPSVEAQI
jgi:hypothetical protein